MSEVVLGNCYEQAARLILDGFYDDLILCHGFPVFLGTGKHHGKRFGHAWCELNGFVFEFKGDEEVLIPKHVYYKIGNIASSKVKRYTATEAMEKIVSTGHWGDWP